MVLIERSRVVAVHLDELERVTAPDAPGVAEAIYASVALRFLMDANALLDVARVHGVSILVDTPNLAGAPLDDALAFAAGGYPYRDGLMRAFYLYREPGRDSPHRAQFERQMAASPDVAPKVSLKFSKFLRAPCLGLMGKVLDRQTLVRYVANKCGGTHYSGGRDKFDDIDNRLTDIGHALQVEDRALSAVFLEALGTAWLLLQSPGVGALREKLRAT